MIRPTLKTVGWGLNATAFATPLLALAMIACSSGAARAVDDFTVKISEKELKLANPTDMMWDKWLTWDIGYQRMIDRNMPYIELTNNSSQPISEFHMSVGDNRFIFGPLPSGGFAQVGTTTPGINLLSSVINGGHDLIVTFPSTLGLGQVARFEINLDVDPAYAATYAASFGSSQPDYRTVLFDSLGPNSVYGPYVGEPSNPGDNSAVFVKFANSTTSDTKVFEDLDPPLDPATFYFNTNLRPYSATDFVRIYQPEGTVIPEPSTIALVVFGLASLYLRGRSLRPVAAA